MTKPTGFHVCPDVEPVAFARNSGLLTCCRNSPCRHGVMTQSRGLAGITHAGQWIECSDNDTDNHNLSFSTAQTSSSLREVGSGYTTRRSAMHRCCVRRTAEVSAQTRSQLHHTRTASVPALTQVSGAAVLEGAVSMQRRAQMCPLSDGGAFAQGAGSRTSAARCIHVRSLHAATEALLACTVSCRPCCSYVDTVE